MKLYVQPLFSNNHPTGSIIKTLGSASHQFSSVRVIYRSKESIKNYTIELREVFNLPKAEKENILKQIKNIESPRKKIAGLSFSKPIVMGILNVTPDSFSDGGLYTSYEKAIYHYNEMVKYNADLIDIGGESTRPGAKTIKVEEELKRIMPILREISNQKKKVPISLDTRKPEVMKKGLNKGVKIINDVSGLRYSKDTIPLLKKTKSPIIIMHSISTPKLMQRRINYKNVLLEIYDYLEKKIIECERNNIKRSQIIIDPGIGFGKNLKQNLNLIKNISLFHSLGVAILLGTSRKSFISKISKNALENERLGGSISSVIFGLSQGVQIFRVHDVMETRQAIDVYNQIRNTQ